MHTFVSLAAKEHVDFVNSNMPGCHFRDNWLLKKMALERSHRKEDVLHSLPCREEIDTYTMGECLKSAWILLSKKLCMNHEEKWNSLSFVHWQTNRLTCCLPKCHHSALLCWQTAPSMFTPVGRGSSGGCLWLHYAVKMKWGSGVDLIRRGRLDKWEWCPLLSFVFDSLMVHISHFFTFFLFSTGYFLSFFISSLTGFNLSLEKLFISIHSSHCSSPSSFLSAVWFEWLLWRWACKGQSNYCVEQHCSLAFCSTDSFHFLSSQQTENVSHKMLTYDRPIIDHYHLFFISVMKYWTKALKMTLKWLWNRCFCRYQHLSIMFQYCHSNPFKILKRDSPRWAFFFFFF